MITNLQNSGIKSIVKLQQKSSERKEKKFFVIEGRRELSIAQQSGFEICEIYICKEIYKPEPSYPIDVNKTNIIQVGTDVYNKIAYRKNAEGIIGLSRMRFLSLNEIKLSSVPLILIAETIEKPGNIGAILRTSDAAGVDVVVFCNQKTDMYNPNVIRSSLGCIFSNQVISCNTIELIEWLKEKKINIFAASPDSEKLYYEMDYTKPTALLLGAEAEGLSENWKQLGKMNIKIPMSGKIDSLNVSVSAAILTYEAIRQRNMKI